MTVNWLEGAEGTRNARADRLRQLIGDTKTLSLAGAYDGMSALLAKRAGFEALYLSGAALSASKALPDLGLLTLDDVTRAAQDLVRASELPIIVDCDTGFGEALNVMRAVRELEQAGVACMQIEDQQFPKKCGHLNDKRIAPAEDMCRKIAAARRASRGMVICARTDAASESLEEAIRRANMYAEAGAEIIFVEALRDEESILRVREECRVPLLANMTEFGRTPQIPVSEWQRYGYEAVIFPVSAFRVAAASLRDFYASLREKGGASEYLPQMMSRAELYETIRYYDYETLDELIVRTVLEQ